MVSRAEQILSSSLRAVLAALPNGASMPQSKHFQEVLTSLQFFLPAVLREIYPEWNQESLDGILPLVARKTREREAEIFGLCIIISDQTLTPLHLQLQVNASEDTVSWLECSLGERGEEGMVRMPYGFLEEEPHALEGRLDLIDWVYKVPFGKRRL